MTRTDDELVHDALDHLRVLRLHIGRADLADQTVADAVSLRLASAGDSFFASPSSGFVNISVPEISDCPGVLGLQDDSALLRLPVLFR